MRSMLGPQRGRQQELDGLSEQLAAREAEQALALAVDQHDPALGIGDQHRDGRGVDRQAEQVR